LNDSFYKDGKFNLNDIKLLEILSQEVKKAEIHIRNLQEVNENLKRFFF